MITLEEARDTIIETCRLGLSGADFLARLGATNVARACNGIGPEDMPDKWRAKLDKWFWLFCVPCRGHDCRFTYDNDGTEAKFRAANDELERNNVIIADSRHVWWNPLRYWERSEGRLMADVCRRFGWGAWRAAQGQFPAGAGNAGG